MLNYLKRRAPADRAARGKISGWAREILELRDEDLVSVNEIDCPHATCGGTETIIIVLPSIGKTHSFRVPAAAELLDFDMLRTALLSSVEDQARGEGEHSA